MSACAACMPQTTIEVLQRKQTAQPGQLQKLPPRRDLAANMKVSSLQMRAQVRMPGGVPAEGQLQCLVQAALLAYCDRGHLLVQEGLLGRWHGVHASRLSADMVVSVSDLIRACILFSYSMRGVEVRVSGSPPSLWPLESQSEADLQLQFAC